MNTPVSYKLAKLLKEKGFDEQNLTIYQDGEVLLLRSTISNSQFMTSRNYTAPTIADFVMWLYEKHGIWMFTDRTNNWFWTIQKSTGENIHQEDLPITEKFICHGFNSPTEAYEAAIEYTLNNLI